VVGRTEGSIEVTEGSHNNNRSSCIILKKKNVQRCKTERIEIFGTQLCLSMMSATANNRVF
jgi:hypothetical protein